MSFAYLKIPLQEFLSELADGQSLKEAADSVRLSAADAKEQVEQWFARLSETGEALSEETLREFDLACYTYGRFVVLTDVLAALNDYQIAGRGAFENIEHPSGASAKAAARQSSWDRPPVKAADTRVDLSDLPPSVRSEVREERLPSRNEMAGLTRLAQGNFERLMDFPLSDGSKLSGATADQLDREAAMYATAARTHVVNARWLKAIAIAMRARHALLVSNLFDEAELSQLRGKAEALGWPPNPAEIVKLMRPEDVADERRRRLIEEDGAAAQALMKKYANAPG